MGTIDLSKLQAGAGMAGLQVFGLPVNSSLVIPSTSYTASQHKEYSVFISANTTKLILSATRINITGASAGLSGVWFPLTGGSGEIVDNNAAGSGTGGFTFNFWLQPGTGGRTFNVSITNRTASTLTFPSITFNIHTNFYTYPWAS